MAVTYRRYCLLPEVRDGFAAGPVGKRELLSGPVVLLVANVADAIELLPDFLERVEGVVLTEGQPALRQLGPLLWHVALPSEMLAGSGVLFDLIQNLAASAAAHRERAINVLRAEARILADLETSREDYLRVTGRLQEQVARLTDAEQALREANELLESRVVERTAELEAALRTVRQARDELERTEKLAALGRIVAGVAHELNTPIGNCLTVATALEERAREFSGAYADGTLRRSQLDTFVEAARTGADLLTHGLLQAHELVGRFKQVAVDQTSDQRRKFDLGGVLAENAAILRPGLARTPITLEIDVPDGIVMDSYPGPLGQVFANLLNNAVLHAFPEGGGSFRIQCDYAPGGKEVTLVFRDDGCGMTPAVQERAFDPFYTTRLGQGGSGLGLSIVYNLVTVALGGQIRLVSVAGEGSAFHVTLPCVAPEASRQHGSG